MYTIGEILYQEKRRTLRGPILIVVFSSGIISAVVLAVVLNQLELSPLLAYGLPAALIVGDLVAVGIGRHALTVTPTDIRMGSGPVGRVLISEIETHRQIDRSTMPVGDPHRPQPRVLGYGHSSGVWLTLRNGDEVIVESDNPVELELAIAKAVSQARRREP
ncbi:MAG: hypothetical protein JJLCMIEE_03405 [Acidimicrobiales bacterium]|nr:MAG: hypothetical protein EDR02_18160 [Actinomycetota bacterium]MBV6510268.1 hypothetical protein [Acidimicrobiales bacterium]RIK02770.1 MAG: hypothetical protein DCC48_17685 [Acidobacteriota bacterium]